MEGKEKSGEVDAAAIESSNPQPAQGVSPHQIKKGSIREKEWIEAGALLLFNVFFKTEWSLFPNWKGINNIEKRWPDAPGKC